MFRFAFDLGSGSLGWAVFELDDNGKPIALRDMGSRIFPTGRDPKSKDSNAAGRRQPRQQRRQIDRRKSRRRRLEEQLVSTGLMPGKADKDARSRFFAIDPYEARQRVAKEQCTLEELGRSIWHISKHRGFKSNRKTDRSNDDDGGKISAAAARLREGLIDEGAATYGSWLANRLSKGAPVRIHLGNEAGYEFYPIRQMLEDEFDQIWRRQAGFHDALTESARIAIRDTVFHQRPLKPVKPGRCTFFPDEYRLAKWHPLAQEFLILQQLNMVRLSDGQEERSLDLTTRDVLFRHLYCGEGLTWKGLRRQLKISEDIELNLEKGGLKSLSRFETAARLTGTKKKPGPLWNTWGEWTKSEKLRLLQILDSSESPEDAVTRLMTECGLDPDTADKVERINLQDGHLMLGERATKAIVEVMREEVIIYSEAVKRASERGLFGQGAVVHHSDLRPAGDPGLSCLPRYNELPSLQHMIGTGTGDPNDVPDIRFGRISNPTVHVALGQFRRVMNALIDRYEKPTEVVIETTRDMAKSSRELNEIERTIKANTKRNDGWRAELEEAAIVAPGQRMGDRLLRMRLWEELGKTPADRLCPYSGRLIALHQLHSDEVEIDHILPFEETFDDSPGNKTVCFREPNRRKGKRAPGEAWQGAELDEIIERVRSAPDMYKKQWRFMPGALEKWTQDKGFEDRQLHATGYLARVVRAYAEALFPKDGSSHIWMPVGRMTAMMRRRWGIFLPDHNAKTRDDHRHHALDAAVVGVIDRRMVQQLQTYARQIGAQQLDRVLPDAPEPFEGYRDQVREMVSRVQVSHRPNHSTGGRLHEDTSYGLIRDVPENQAALTIGNVVVRKQVINLTAKEIGQVRDERLRQELLQSTEGMRGDKRQLADSLKKWSIETGHNRLRVIKPAANARAICDDKGMAYKWVVPDGIACMDILEGQDGNWFHRATDIWSAQSGRSEYWQNSDPNVRLIFRIFKNDTVQLFDLDEEGLPIAGTNRVRRVVRLEPSANRIRLVGINEAGDYEKRHIDRDDQFRWDLATISKLKARRARRVRIDELGRVLIVPHGNFGGRGRS